MKSSVGRNTNLSINPLPNARVSPSTKPLMYATPLPKFSRQIPPRCSHPQYPQNDIHEYCRLSLSTPPHFPFCPGKTGAKIRHCSSVKSCLCKFLSVMHTYCSVFCSLLISSRRYLRQYFSKENEGNLLLSVPRGLPSEN